MSCPVTHACWGGGPFREVENRPSAWDDSAAQALRAQCRRGRAVPVGDGPPIGEEAGSRGRFRREDREREGMIEG